MEERLARWRDQIQSELRSDSRHYLGRKHPRLADILPNTFPDPIVLAYYTNPLISTSSRNSTLWWSNPPDVSKLATLCELYFGWDIVNRFQTVLWPGACAAALRISIGSGSTGTISTPSTSSASAFSLPPLSSPTSNANLPPFHTLFVVIHSERRHSSTDMLHEARVELNPEALVLLAASGIRGVRQENKSNGKQPRSGSTPPASRWEARLLGKRWRSPSIPDESNDPPARTFREWLPVDLLMMGLPEATSAYQQQSRSTKITGAGKGMSTSDVSARFTKRCLLSRRD